MKINRNNATYTETDTAVRSQRRKHIRYAILSAAAALLLFIVAVSVRSISDNREYKKYYNAGQEAYYAGDYESALGSLRRAAEIEARDDCMLLTVDCYISLGNYEKALEILENMDVRDANVASRIDRVKALVAELENSEKVLVGGKAFSIDTKTVVLNSMNLSDSVFEEISALYSLESLSLAENRLCDITLIANLGGLITLDLSENNISDISALSSLVSLRTLYLDRNPVDDLSPLYALKNLATLSIKGIDITENELAELSKALPDCAIHCEAANSDVLDITLGGCTFKSNVKELDLSGLSIRDISSLSNCKQLTKLRLNGNSISDISPLMDIPYLSYLDISNNEISDLRPLMGISHLSYLNVSSNLVSSTVPLVNLSALNELYLDSNPISDFSGLRKLRNVSTLGLSDTGLKDTDLENLEGLSSLYSLDIRDNAELSGEGVDRLKSSIYYCSIQHSELAYSIIIGDRSFKNSDTVIDLSSLGISDVSQITSFLHPENVNLANNSISGIYNLQYCTSIKTLNLAGNIIDDISALAPLTRLENLDLSNNYIDNLIFLYNLHSLRSLNLSGNPLTEEQIDDLRYQLPDCTIYF